MSTDFSTWLARLPSIVPNLNEHPLDHILNKENVGEGIIVECGVYSGNSITKIANKFSDRKIYGFDSFEGLPDSWNRTDMTFDKGSFNLHGILPSVPANVELIKGWFNNTLPVFASGLNGTKIALLHVDCDLYLSTKTVFDVLGEHLANDCIILFDELFNYPTFEKHEILAFYEFMQLKKNLTLKWIGKNGHVDTHPVTYNGYWDQPAAIRISTGN